jgi:hypothetical protein
MSDIDFIEIDLIEAFKKYHPKDRIYEVPIDGDRYREYRYFEIADTWRVRMECVGIDRKNGIAKYKRTTPMYFGNEEY